MRYVFFSTPVALKKHSRSFVYVSKIKGKKELGGGQMLDCATVSFLPLPQYILTGQANKPCKPVYFSAYVLKHKLKKSKNITNNIINFQIFIKKK